MLFRYMKDINKQIQLVNKKNIVSEMKSTLDWINKLDSVGKEIVNLKIYQ